MPHRYDSKYRLSIYSRRRPGYPDEIVPASAANNAGNDGVPSSLVGVQPTMLRLPVLLVPNLCRIAARSVVPLAAIKVDPLVLASLSKTKDAPARRS